MSSKGKEKVSVEKKRIQRKRWKYKMELPLDARDVGRLWEFVASHEEDTVRKTPCKLAEKARVKLAGRVSVREVQEGRCDPRGPLRSIEDVCRSIAEGNQLGWTTKLAGPSRSWAGCVS